MTTERTKGATAAMAGVAGGSLITWLLTSRAQAAPPGVDPALWELLQNMLQAILDIQALLAPGGVAEDPFANMPKFTTGQVICTTALRGFQLPSIIIPKNKQLVVKALPGNITWIWVAVIQADSQNILVSYPLVPNEGVGLLIQNANLAWVMAPTINDGIAYIVEQA